MSATVYCIDPTELLLQPTEKKSPFVNRKTNPSFARASDLAKPCSDRAGRPTRPSLIRVPEEPLWKLAQLAVSARLTIVEHAFLPLVLVLGAAAIISSFAELSHLMQTDAIGHFAARVLGAHA